MTLTFSFWFLFRLIGKQKKNDENENKKIQIQERLTWMLLIAAIYHDLYCKSIVIVFFWSFNEAEKKKSISTNNSILVLFLLFHYLLLFDVYFSYFNLTVIVFSAFLWKKCLGHLIEGFQSIKWPFYVALYWELMKRIEIVRLFICMFYRINEVIVNGTERPNKKKK